MRYLYALVACWVAFCLVIPGALIAYGEFRKWLADRYGEHQAQRAELTMQEAAAAPFVAPFAHELTDGSDEYERYVADVLALTERVSVPKSPVIPMQRGGSRG